MSRTPFDPPIDPDMNCRNCGDPIVATARVHETGAFSIGGLRSYDWTHAHGDTTCRPKTTADPYNDWDATRLVEAIVDAREAAEDALLDALKEAEVASTARQDGVTR